jgi:hypothetical protein
MKLENWSSALPFLTVALIILGIFLQQNYYSYFDINIYKYLDTTEILFSFAPLSELIVWILLFYLMFGIYASLNDDSKTRSIKKDILKEIYWNYEQILRDGI